VEIGPHRRFDWLEMDLEEIRKIRKALGGTINDVVLAITSGALRRFLHRRGDDVDGLDFRVMMPVNVRTAETRNQLGNQVAMITARLPLDEPSARHRLERVIAETTRSKASPQASGMQAPEEISDGAVTTLFTQFARLTARSRPFNVIVTNVPGPSFPIWLLGAKMLSVAPLVPLFENQALGIALFSYDGRLFWGFNADWDVLPDLHELVLAAHHELEALASAASLAGAVENTEMAAARSA
jgi:WS/DGAT/MGAT family acyltransferase